MAHNETSDACGDWFKYTLEATPSDAGLQEGSFLDQPVMGQDSSLLLFGGAAFTNAGALSSFVAFSYPKNCAYNPDCQTNFTVFHPQYLAVPASSATPDSYFVASIKNTGYALYRMDDNTSLTLQGILGIGPGSVMPPPRDAGQPGTSNPIELEADHPDTSSRIPSSPVFDGTRIWFVHQAAAGNHPSIRYGAINPATNSVDTEIVYHNATSDDFNPSIAIGINGASRTIFLNWAYTDVKGGMPVSDAVAAVTIGATAPPPPVIGKDITLVAGGITNDDRYGDYSSVAIDPASPGQACAVAAQEYFDPATNGKWATRIGIFGAPGC
jgi:hypothetical protein